MKKEKKYCSYCGITIQKHFIDDKDRDYCVQCKTVYYENPLPVASCILINNKREVLLVKRKKDPYKDMWCLPIGFAESGEEVKDAALRELREETGLFGEIVKLIDVDTIENYFYGSLAIITYEVQCIGGELAPGDDASDVRYFPINETPALAWSSNSKAIALFLELYRDGWAMIDSFKEMYPYEENFGIQTIKREHQGVLLSTLLINVIEKDMYEILKSLNANIIKLLELSNEDILILEEVHAEILNTVKHQLLNAWTGKDDEHYTELGKKLCLQKVPLTILYTICAASRGNIWLHIIKKNIIISPLDIFTALEFNNRVVYIYDKIIHALIDGFCNCNSFLRH